MEDSFFSCQIISEFEEADADYLLNLQSTEAGSASSLMDYEDEHTCMDFLLSPAAAPKEKSKKPRKCSHCHQLARMFVVLLPVQSCLITTLETILFTQHTACMNN